MALTLEQLSSAARHVTVTAVNSGVLIEERFICTIGGQSNANNDSQIRGWLTEEQALVMLVIKEQVLRL
jgi:hypothetical protein